MKRNRAVCCVVALVLCLFCLVGCGEQEQTPTEPTVFVDGQSMGEGAVTFTFTVVDLDGTEASLQVSTDKTTVGAALLELGVIKGDMGEYGLYINTVNGITYDYAKDGAYWGLYINGEYALTGVDGTEIVAGTTYTLKAEKA